MIMEKAPFRDRLGLRAVTPAGGDIVRATGASSCP
jgi:hypothetical protein